MVVLIRNPFKKNLPIPLVKEVIRPTVKTNYPAGFAVETEKNIYFLTEKTKFRVFSDRVLLSWDFPYIIQTTESAIAHYKNASAPLGFRAGTVVQNYADAKIYVISDGKRRLITDPDILSSWGLSEKNIISVSDLEISLHADGEVIR